MAEHIRGLIRTYAISGMKDPGTEGLIWDIMFIDPVTMRHFAQFQEMWKHRQSRRSPYREWWKAFRDFLRDCLDKTRTQMNKYHKENPPGPDHDSVHSDDEARTKWFPGTPKMHPPSQKRNAPLAITSAPGPPEKKQKLDNPPTRRFRLVLWSQATTMGQAIFQSSSLQLYGTIRGWKTSHVRPV